MPGDGEQVTEVLHFWFAESLPRQIWLMPLMHKEDLELQEVAVQEAALPLFERFSDPRTAYFARSHRDVIARFGRFPHRNAALGRGSSAEKLAFLQTPGSGFCTPAQRSGSLSWLVKHRLLTKMPRADSLT
jgi:hypothetical protein